MTEDATAGLRLSVGQMQELRTLLAPTPVRTDASAFVNPFGDPAYLTGGGIGSVSQAELGETPQLFLGRGNLLLDPLFTSLPLQTTLTTSFQNLGGWSARYTLLSGTAPSDVYLTRSRTRLDTAFNPVFNSDLICFSIWNSAPITGKIRVEMWSDQYSEYEQSSDTAPYINAAARFFTTVMESISYPYLTSSKAWVELWANNNDLVGTSAVIDYVAWNTAMGDGNYDYMQTQLAAFGETKSPFAYADWQLVIKWEVEYTNQDVFDYVLFAEPSLSYNVLPQPQPFSPQVSAWVPEQLSGWDYRIRHDYSIPGSIIFDTNDYDTAMWLKLRSGAAGKWSSIQLFEDSEAQYRVEISTYNGAGIRMGPGGSTAADIEMQRTGAKTLTFSDDAGGSISVKGVGRGDGYGFFLGG